MLRTAYACCAWLALALPAIGQVTAKIEGPDETEPGNLVVLTVGDSQAQVFKWVLIGAPPSSFAPFDGGKSCVFARGVAGDYRFVLVAGGPDASGKLAVAIAEKVVRIKGALPPTPIPNPTPGPTPTPTPGPITQGKRTAVIFRETADQSPDLARMIVALRSGTTDQYLKSKGHKLIILDKDAEDEQGNPIPLALKVQGATQGKTLPQLVVIESDSGAVLSVEPLGSNAESVVDAIKKAGG